MTALQIVLISGILLGTGLAWLWLHHAPSHPDAKTTINAYSLREAQRADRNHSHLTATSRQDRIGMWAAKKLPPSLWAGTPTADLDLLQTPAYRHYGKKIISALAALIIVPLITYIWSIVGIRIPFVVPVGATFALAFILWVNPDRSVRRAATKAREHFVRSLAVYCDLVAVERQNRGSTRQAMENAAAIGDDNWAFRRIAEELDRSRYSGLPPWDALAELSRALQIPQLLDLADILRLSQESQQIYASLRSRARELRQGLQKSETAAANRIGNLMSVPALGLAGLFAFLLVAAQGLRLMGLGG